MTQTPEHAPPPTIADVYAHLATDLDEGENPDITIRGVLDAIRVMAPRVFAEAARDAGFVPRAPEPDAGGLESADADEEAPDRHVACDTAIAGLRAQLGQIRELAESWAGRAPAARTIAEDFTISPRDAVSSDCGRCILGILEGKPEPGGEHAETADTAGILGLNGGNLVRWSGAAAPGGYVCAVPVPGNPDDICGHPVESEPCPEHRDPAWRPE